MVFDGFQDMDVEVSLSKVDGRPSISSCPRPKIFENRTDEYSLPISRSSESNTSCFSRKKMRRNYTGCKRCDFSAICYMSYVAWDCFNVPETLFQTWPRVKICRLDKVTLTNISTYHVYKVIPLEDL